jgi:hypothetical protein
MPYRTPAERKPVRVRIVLTRGEVLKIVQKHLQDKEKIPSDFPAKANPKYTLEHLRTKSNDSSAPDLAPEDPKDWGAWPGMAFEWTEEVP